MNYYEILGVDRTANKEDIKKVYAGVYSLYGQICELAQIDKDKTANYELLQGLLQSDEKAVIKNDKLLLEEYFHFIKFLS